MIEFKETAQWLQDAIANIPADMKKQFDYSFDLSDRIVEQMKAKGYYMNSSYADTQRVYINNVSAPWVEDGSTVIRVDENVVKWIRDTKEGINKGYIHSTEGLWTDTWNEDQGADSKVFGFFGPAWLINFTIQPNYGEDAEPDWAVCNPPQEYYRGGSFLIGCAGTDNPAHVKDIMLKMTADKDILIDITKDYTEFTNTMSGMKELAADESFGSDFLCGQNPYAYYEPACANVSADKISAYDQGCVEGLNVFSDYFNDKVTFEEAQKNYETVVMERYPEITEVVWPE